MKTMAKVLFVIFLVVLSTSCGMKNLTVSVVAKIATDGMSSMESESDLWIAKQSIIPLTKVMEVFGNGAPGNRRFSTLMAQVYGNVAFGFFEPEYMSAKDGKKEVWRSRMERYYKLGYKSGMASMKKRFGRSIGGTISDFQRAIAGARRRDVRMLFWTAFDLGNLINLNRDDIQNIADLPKVSAMLDRILQLNRNFAYGSALAFNGAMLASRPSMLGGNPEKARDLFEEAIRVADGKYLMTKVMYAEWYAIPRGDMELARGLLKDVVDADDDIFPAQALANQLAKERAEILLKKI